MSDSTQKLSPEKPVALPSELTFDPRDALKSPEDRPGVYMGFWGEYNSGSYWGNWIDLGQIESKEDLEACIQYLREKHCQPGEENLREEWMIQDSQNLPSELQGENPDLEKLAEFSQTAQEVGEENLAALLAACNNLGQLLDADQFQECFCGYWDSLARYAMELADQTAGTPHELELMDRWPFNCIDWEAAGRELRLGGDVWTEFIDGEGLAVFRNI